MQAPAKADLLIEHCQVVTCDEAGTIHADGALVVADGKISWVGSRADLPDVVVTQRVDGGAGILAPGLVNCHCHLADSLFRGLVEDLALEDWLQSIWQAEGAILNPQTTRLGAQLGLAELALGGVTCVNDMFWHADEAAQAAKEIGLRIVTGGLFFDPPGMDGKQAAERLGDAREFCEKWREEPLVELAVTPHGAYTVAPDNLVAAFELAGEFDALYHMHASETARENEIVAKDYGVGVVGHLDKLGLLGPRTILAHVVHVDSHDIELLAASGTNVTHNPVSNLKLGSGIAPLPELLAAGVPVGLGTDGAVSGNDIDMWLALRLACIVHRGVREDCVAVKASQAMHAAMLGGARALGLADRIGSLEAGKQADCILLDVRKPHAQPLFNPHTHLVFGAGKSDVTDVWVGGQRVVAGREVQNLDMQAMHAELDSLAPAIQSSLQ